MSKSWWVTYPTVGKVTVRVDADSEADVALGMCGDEQWIVRREDGAAVEGPFYADADADRRLTNIRDRCLAPVISKRRLICLPDLLILTTHEVAERYGIVLSPVFPGAVAGAR